MVVMANEKKWIYRETVQSRIKKDINKKYLIVVIVLQDFNVRKKEVAKKKHY